MKRTDAITKLVGLILFGALVAYFGVYLIRSFTNDTRTAPAVYVSIAESSTATGIIVRDESLVSSNEKYLSVVAENGRVSAQGEVLAVAYSGEDALSRAAEIHELEQKKTHISEVMDGLDYADRAAERDNAIKSSVTRLAAASARRDMDTLSSAALSLGSLIMDNSDAGAKKEDLDKINTELNSLKQAASRDTVAIRAEKAGLFSSAPDGYEGLTPKALAGLDIDKLAALSKEPAEIADNVYGKIVSAYEWYYAAAMPEKDAERLKVGGSAKLNFGRYCRKLLTAKVESISAPKNGECAVVFRCTEAASEILSVRKVSADIDFDTHEGIRVPKNAVYTDDGDSYVFTMTGLQAEKKYIKIAWETEDYFLAELEKDAKALRVGNEIILTSKELFDGEILQ
ncbi:MAG: HlyD family efflux transporter periplasmic adaptor subunit [Oscillospiraceae bacterium]